MTPLDTPTPGRRIRRPTCSRRLEFDAAHRVMRHESKCRHLHGHRYVAEITAAGDHLDAIGRVVDFGVIKEVVGAWIDDHWDHGTILNRDDRELAEFVDARGWRLYTIDGNPTAEILAAELLTIANGLLRDAAAGVEVVHVRLYETPNCWADCALPDA